MPDRTDNANLGLAGPLTFAPQITLGDWEAPYSPKVIADMEAMQHLRISLDLLAAKSEPDDLLPVTRANVIALLSCLESSLSEGLQRQLSDTQDPVVFFDHPAMTLLRTLIGALKDLDNAKTHSLFYKPKTSKGGALTSAEVAKRDALLESVDIVKAREGFSSRKDAEEWVARKMQDKLGRRNAPKADQLKEMRKTRKRQQQRTR